MKLNTDAQILSKQGANSVRGNDVANNTGGNFKSNDYQLPPETQAKIDPEDILFQHDTITLIAGAAQSIIIDSGVNRIVVYVPSSLTTTIAVQFSLGGYIDPSHRFDCNLAIGASGFTFILPAQQQTITLIALTNNAVVTVMGLRNCDFYSS